jgi:hypothetical protein
MRELGMLGTVEVQLVSPGAQLSQTSVQPELTNQPAQRMRRSGKGARHTVGLLVIEFAVREGRRLLATLSKLSSLLVLVLSFPSLALWLGMEALVAVNGLVGVNEVHAHHIRVVDAHGGVGASKKSLSDDVHHPIVLPGGHCVISGSHPDANVAMHVGEANAAAMTAAKSDVVLNTINLDHQLGISPTIAEEVKEKDVDITHELGGGG